uniref:Putative zinc finger family protein n=1 Tax=Davidia involucrata TaxID=16924 RepID=A0A5B7BHL3_DAVIN
MLVFFSFPSSNSHSSSSSSSFLVSSKVIQDSINLITLGAIIESLPESCDTCAMCLDQLRKRDQVRLLGNCCHVFHRPCLDRWLDYNAHKTCPLCRTPLLTTTTTISFSSSPHLSRHQQPSWIVEQLLYLFCDDLLL